MATKIVNAQTNGMYLWLENEHKKGILDGLKIDNQSVYTEKINLKDAFSTDAGYTSGGSAYSAQALVSGSAINKFQITVAAGDVISLGEEDLKGLEFLGRATVVADTTTSNCIITGQYHLV